MIHGILLKDLGATAATPSKSREERTYVGDFRGGGT
jgi:hypothetical protein